MKIIPKRRRREYKTNYKNRFNLLKSGKLRAVVRKSNRYIIGQIIETKNSQDRVVFSFNSKKLLDQGWPEKFKGSLKSLPAAYLTGFVLGKQSKPKSEIILDLGLNRSIPKSKIYSFLKGLVDSGVNIKADKKILPKQEDIAKNQEIKLVIEKIKK